MIIGIEIFGFFSNEECDKRFEDEKRRFASAQPLVISKSKRPSGDFHHTLDALVANLTFLSPGHMRSLIRNQLLLPIQLFKIL